MESMRDGLQCDRLARRASIFSRLGIGELVQKARKMASRPTERGYYFTRMQVKVIKDILFLIISLRLIK